MPHVEEVYRIQGGIRGFRREVRERVYDESDVLAVSEQEATIRKVQGQHLCHECGLDDNVGKNGTTNIATKGLGKDITCPLSSLGAVCEPALDPSGADRASATVRLRAELDVPDLRDRRSHTVSPTALIMKVWRELLARLIGGVTVKPIGRAYGSSV
jgi:hypothetical protein